MLLLFPGLAFEMAAASSVEDDGSGRLRGRGEPATPVSPTARWTAALTRTARIHRDPTLVLPRLVAGLGERFGDAPALIGEDETLSFAALADRVNRYAGWTIEQGIGRGDVVCLMIPNRPDLMAAWLGISQAGATAALLSPGLTGRSLRHCIDLVAPTHLIATPDGADPLAAILPDLASRPKIWMAGGEGPLGPPIADRLAEQDGSRFTARNERHVTLADRALLIYTSGTTGLPKAAQLSHHRLVAWSEWFAGLMDVSPADRLYDCLPMHHSVGGVVGPGSALLGGGSVVIRERFSARRFWDDVADTRCTLFQYVGELCRFLVNAPVQEGERRHRLRLCVGNGLRPDIWERFRDRFGIPDILEFYAATESTVSLYNVEQKVGSVGRIPTFLRARPPALLLRYDPDRDEMLRRPDGTCIRAETDEVGALVGRIGRDPGDLAARFEGYSDPEASARKVVRDVLVPGDAWFLTGDLMRRDDAGFFYFVDRVGETFRWRGENVSTTEVADAVRRCPGVLDVAVYGVEVPGHEGRAGMAAIVAEAGFDPATLGAALSRDLPAYAAPVFVRLLPALDMTETFKPKKRLLVEEGFDLASVRDPLFVRSRSSESYVLLDAATHDRVVSDESFL